MRIKLLRRYSIHAPGKVVDCEDGIAERLVADGTAERLDAPRVIETASLDPVVERAEQTPKRKRGRPRNAVPQSEAADAPGS